MTSAFEVGQVVFHERPNYRGSRGSRPEPGELQPKTIIKVGPKRIYVDDRAYFDRDSMTFYENGKDDWGRVWVNREVYSNDLAIEKALGLLRAGLRDASDQVLDLVHRRHSDGVLDLDSLNRAVASTEALNQMLAAMTTEDQASTPAHQ